MAAAYQDAAFKVGLHGSLGDVGAADERGDAVDDEDLRVEGRS